MNFYISDLHLGHANVIKFDRRPFKNVKKMNRALIDNWCDRVRKDDTVYILGDLCWGTEKHWLEILPQLTGKKVLIKGNHDLKQPSSSVKKFFQDIKDYKCITDCQKNIIMCHYAIPFHKGAYDPNTYMLFGHVHNTRENDYLDALRECLRDTADENRGNAKGNFINVGCMMPWMDYTPRTIDEIIDGFEEWRREYASWED